MAYLTLERTLIADDGTRGCMRVEGGTRDGRTNCTWHGEHVRVIYDGPVADLVAAAEAALTLEAQHREAMTAAGRVTPIKITPGHLGPAEAAE